MRLRRVPGTSASHSRVAIPKVQIKMSPSVVFCVLLFGVFAPILAAPSQAQPKTFFFDGLTKGFTISRVTTDDNAIQQPTNGYQVRFVPLISLLAGMFPNIMAKLGQFTGVNRVTTTATNNRRFPLADKAQENSITAPPLEDDGSQEEGEDDDNEDYTEQELIECDGHHLGVWPDKTDPQRYYKCEVDPRTSPTTSCIREMMNNESGKELHSLERIEVPGVKPCYLLSMLKCANGFKYQHSTRICVPDIVYGHRH